MAMEIQIEVFWVVMPWSLHPKERGSKGPPKWYPNATLHSITTQKTTTSLAEMMLLWCI